MTYKKAIFYYSLSGNTKALIENTSLEGFDIFQITISNYKQLSFEPYDIILLGTSTLGDGEPPRVFKYLAPTLGQLKGKKIGLFGSGNKIYRHFCGALDLLHDFLIRKNEILFVYKFDEYPTEKVLKEFEQIIKGLPGNNR